jgi:hypothetical protein
MEDAMPIHFRLYRANVWKTIVCSAVGIGVLQRPYLVLADSESVMQNPDWFVCKSDGDCRLVDGQCGRHSVVNRGYTDDYERWVAATDDKSKCVTPKLKDGNIKIQATSELRANCREGQCVVQTDEQESGQ